MSDTPDGGPERFEPYIPATTTLPEITAKAVVLGIVLSILLAGANAYVGLLAGMTVSASIPAAVVSMAVLRLFRRSNILENNIVQTAASAGESLAAGVIFTLPALIILDAWTEFAYWQTTIIAALGGLIGVLFTIPLRRSLVVGSTLKFPEGLATAEVLKVGDRADAGIMSLVFGSLIGAVFKLGDTGLGLWTQTIEGASRVGGSVAYFGSNLLPSLLAVGYIVGINIAVLVFLGGALNWFVAIPIIAASGPWPADTGAVDYAYEIWSGQTRYLGVGAMVVGGLWALVRMGPSILTGITSGIRAFRGGADDAAIARTERDTPMTWVLAALALSVIPLFFVFKMAIGSVVIAAVMSVIMLIAGFLFAAVASYMAGLVGSSNNPISGVTIATLLIASLLLLGLMKLLDIGTAGGAAAAIMMGGVVCCAAAIGGDNMQDLKAGHLLGATPRKQQIMQVVGVIAAAALIAPILQLLLGAYGIVEPAREGAVPLEAPQATLMASVAGGVFDATLPWSMVWIGMAMAVVIIVIDLALERARSAFRMPILAVAVGIYLPLELATPILAGGLVSWAAHRFHARRVAAESDGRLQSSLIEARDDSQRKGLLFAAGLITGEALLGILLAIPIVLTAKAHPLQLGGDDFVPTPGPGVALLTVVTVVLYFVARGRRAS